MKKIYNIFLTAAALLAFAPGIFAQGTYSMTTVLRNAGELGTDQELTFDEESFPLNYDATNSFAAQKTISAPVNGKYWIKLETFATGNAVQTVSSTPSDVLLVLDVSNSMSNNPYGNYNSRLAALKDAAVSFVKTIYENAVTCKESDENYVNRVGIVSFGGSTTNVTSGWVDVQNTTYGYNESSSSTTSLNYKINHLSTNTGTRTDLGLKAAIDNYLAGSSETSKPRSGANLTVVLFTDGEPAAGGSTVGGQSGAAWNDYVANYAVYYAYQIKNNYTDYNTKLYTILLGSGDDVEDFAEYLSSNFPKAYMDYTTINNQEPAWPTGITNVDDPDDRAVKKDSDGNVVKDDDGNIVYDTSYYKQVPSDGSVDLTAIFEAIASQSAGSTNTSLSAATSTVDVVSSSFDLPDGASTTIYVFTARCTKAQVEGTKPTEAEVRAFEFAEEILVDHSTDTFVEYDEDGKVTDSAKDVDALVTYSIDGNKISVKGFDYSNNWCGPVKQSGTYVSAHGHKVIILIPIEMSEDAVGGANVQTNASGSGIYVNETDTDPLISFESPEVDLPVNIHINKQGLKVGESAKFTITRSYDGFDKNIEYVTSVFVTRHSGQEEDDPITYVRGLPSTTEVGNVRKVYVYKITEENWGWSYEFKRAEGKNSTGATVTVTDKTDVTTDKFTTNPIIFVNKNDATLDYKVRHAESKATNTFKTGGGAGYDDSKSNGRTVITVTAEE